MQLDINFLEKYLFKQLFFPTGCLFNQTQCSPNSEFCYDHKTQRCDGVLHCPGGEDELDCGKH